MIPDPCREDDLPRPPLRTVPHFWMMAAVLVGLGAALLAVDVPLASWVHDGHAPGSLKKVAGLSEIASHGLGIVLIVIVIAVLDPLHRYAIPRILAASLGAGLMANVGKLLLARLRPHHVDFAAIDRGLATFGEWLPLASNPSWQQGFPSAHTATAAGLAIVLAALYPRGRWLFPAVAALAGLERVLHQAHFASDVMWGAAVGCVFAPLCVYGSPLSACFDRLEAKLLSRNEADTPGTAPRPHVSPGASRPAA